MEKNEFRKNAYDMIYLTRCAVKGETPDKTKINAVNLTALFEVCQEHILTGCVAYALASAGIRDNNFTQAKEKAIRKNILLDAERKKILNCLEQQKIWYMPLKGAILKDWYPKLGMRQMSDNDILCDETKRTEIKKLMLDMGFQCDHFEKGNDDGYSKPPVCSFEMHIALFSASEFKELQEYYADVKSRLVKDENNAYGWHFRTEDFYIYITAHEYKHFMNGGTGVRSLVDTYIFMQKFKDALDWEYINSELAKLGIISYERESRELSEKLFSGQKLSEAEKKRLDYYIFSGAYGNIENKIECSFEKTGSNSKIKYIFRRVFPSMEQIKLYWGFFYRHKWLIPVLWVYRIFHAVFVNRKNISAELKALKDR